MSLLGVFGGLFKGGGIGNVVETIGSTIDRFVQTADEKAAFQTLMARMKLDEAKLQQEYELAMADRDARLVESVNATMRSEARSEHWAQWMWRPCIGFTFAGTIINNFILLPYLRKFGLGPIDIPPDIWTAMLVILGVAAGTRGFEKINAAKAGNGATK